MEEKSCQLHLIFKPKEKPIKIRPLKIFKNSPILGSNRSLIKISDQEILTNARKSKMSLSYYLSTLANSYYSKERTFQEQCQENFGGEIEVQIRNIGRIDLINEHSIYEIKDINLWKHALGQILVYSLYYPNLKKVIVLTPKETSYSRKDIEKVCKKFDVDVIYL